MGEMVERVARALCEVDMLEMLRSGMVADKCSPIEAALAAPGAIDELWPNYVVAARAAIEAMREPTEAMIYPGRMELTDEPTNRDIADCYSAMIDAALIEVPVYAPKAFNPQQKKGRK